MSVTDDYTAKMIARFGFRVSRAQVCPRVVAGKRCRVGWPGGRDCLCMRYNGSVLLDHARIWRTPRGEAVLTAEPYGLKDRYVAAFRAEIAPLGLELEVTNESYWFVGTTLIIVRQRGQS